MTKVPAEGPRLAPRVAAITIAGTVAGLVGAAGNWPVAIGIGILATIGLPISTHRSFVKRKAQYAERGVDPDYTAWEARTARRVSLFAVGVLVFFGLLVTVLLIATSTR